jgi:hypothetical protein
LDIEAKKTGLLKKYRIGRNWRPRATFGDSKMVEANLKRQIE